LVQDGVQRTPRRRQIPKNLRFLAMEYIHILGFLHL
jgi:hypothetical protein